MVALIFLPIDCCDDGEARSNAPSSFGQAVQIFRFRGGREKPVDASLLFERVFIGLYHHESEQNGLVQFFDVRKSPPKRGRPKTPLTLEGVVAEIVKAYDDRNRPVFVWDAAIIKGKARPARQFKVAAPNVKGVCERTGLS